MYTENELCDRILVSLRRIIRAIELHSRKLFQAYQLTEPQLVLLREVMRQDVAPIGDLAKRASLSNATITGIVDRLERRGLVQRTRGDKDRRQVLVRGTAAGVALLAHAPSPLQERFMRAWAGLPHEEQVQIMAVLNRVASMMDAGDEQASLSPSSSPSQAIEGTAESQAACASVPSASIDVSPSALTLPPSER